MIDKVRPYQDTFAALLKQGVTFSMHRTGGKDLRITEPPSHLKNLVGQRTYMFLHVVLLETGAKCTMVLPSTSTVFIRPE